MPINELLLEGLMECNALEAELMELELIEGLDQPTYTHGDDVADSIIKFA